MTVMGLALQTIAMLQSLNAVRRNNEHNTAKECMFQINMIWNEYIT